ncbi:PAS domain S-box-containing protein/diguanylate cyclase (GGDEF) domain-containing protein [Palleronia marisminoris]|uniref:Cyclic di-GMP phosphodiesterase Gmr n=1 Tax=Palleronia marisminoris TaxID=315423 RepID=A0A1Y5SXD5_9RHOB|nr:EAL domain-containing protein [Palleronia marisminoris]SFH00444.1 PAS domain S-box-containing protein/diguanylate cyclase (GGDEF) domain-containing protein [Palleronia marisminoris]SLN49033.1 Cyclic di-GMP phosphodiesterase Gmr [Palleronia marisminoris]
MDTPKDFDAAQLFQNHPDPMWVYDLQTLGFLAVNEAAVAQYGYSHDEFLAMTIADIRPAEDVDALRRSVVQDQRGHSPSDLWRHRRKSGDLLYVEITSQAFAYRDRPARLVTARDARGWIGATPSQSRAQSRLRLAKWELDLERNQAKWSPSVYAIFGLDPRTWSNTRENFFTLLHPEDRNRYRRAQAEAIRTGSLFDVQYRARHVSGAERVLHEVGETLQVSGRPIFSAVMQDITEIVKMRADSARLEARLGEIIEGMSDAFYLLDREWRFSYVNRNAEALLGRACEELTGRVLWDEFPELAGTLFEAALREARSSGMSRRVIDYYAPFDKSLEVTVHPGCEDVAVYFHDVSEEVRVTAQRQLINVAISRLNDVVFIIEVEPASGQPKIIYANEATRRLTGYGPEELIGQTPGLFHGPQTAGPALDRLYEALQQGGHAQEDLVNYTRQGVPYWVEVNLSPIFDESGACTHFIAVERDVTERKNTERALRLAATKDHLTGLPNRSTFTEILGRELKTVHETGGTLALLFIDFDNFKNVNDTLGHSVGDELLLVIAERLARVVRQRDGLARFGGDEFVVIAPGADVEAAQILAERLLEVFLEPFDLVRERVSLTASIGIVVAPEDGRGAEELIRKADIAMYRSKSAGRNQATQFDDALHQAVLRNMGLTQALQQSLAAGEGLSLVYQPQYALEGEQRLVGAEALLRWQHPERGAVSPTEFIPAAERAGLIRMLDRQVIEMASRQIGDWKRQGRCTRISVNVSANTLQWEGLATFILEQLAAHDVPPHLFGVEIIETLLLESSRTTIGSLLELRRAGISIAIDDFGTGHSSLGYLQDLPVDTIKIDRSFVQGLEEGKGRKAPLVQAILAMARALDLNVVAEGVETEAQRAWLKHNGCQTIQGFLIGRPTDAGAFASSCLAELSSL